MSSKRKAAASEAAANQPEHLLPANEPAADPVDATHVPAAAAVVQIPLADLQPSPFNPRTAVDDAKLAELAADIAERGVLQPVVVRYVGAGDARKPELVFGHRRAAAARRAGLASVPALLRSLTDAEVVLDQLAENLQREDFSPLDEARGYAQALPQFGGKVDALAAAVSKSRRVVYERLQLLKLAPAAVEALQAGTIGAEVARYVARVPAAHQAKAVELATAPDWRGERKSTRQVRDELLQAFALELERAPFPTDDATLLASAGACTTCPKRSGANVDLLGDIVSDDDSRVGGEQVCTDPDCFAAKRAALRAREAAALVEKTGAVEVIAGEAAKRALKVDRYSGKVELKGSQLVPLASVRKALAKVGDARPATVLVQDDASGKVVEAVRRKDLEAAGITPPAIEKRPSPQQQYEAQREQREAELRKRAAAHDAEQAARMAIFEALIAAVEQRPRSKVELRQVVRELVDRLDWHQDRAAVAALAKAWRCSTNLPALAKRVDALDAENLGRLAVLLVAARQVNPQNWRGTEEPTALHALATANGLDVAALRKASAPPPQAAPAPAKRGGGKAAKAKGKSSAGKPAKVTKKQGGAK